MERRISQAGRTTSASLSPAAELNQVPRKSLGEEMKLVFASLLCLCGIVAAVPIPQDEDLPPMPVVKDFNMLDNELGEV